MKILIFQEYFICWNYNFKILLIIQKKKVVGVPSKVTKPKTNIALFQASTFMLKSGTHETSNGLVLKVTKLGLIIATYFHVMDQFNGLIMCIKGEIKIHDSNLLGIYSRSGNCLMPHLRYYNTYYLANIIKCLL
jgi:hypothetical protein